MAFHVPSPVLFKTTKCPHNFSCLKSEDGKCPSGCEVQEAIGETLLTLKNKEERPSCPYRASVMDLQLCSCPTHIALYQQLQQGETPTQA